jgi:hypothetical protein
MTTEERVDKLIIDYNDYRKNTDLRWLVQEAIEQAVVAERERCTRIAEGERVEDVGECDSAYNMAIDHVTAAIREGDA